MLFRRKTHVSPHEDGREVERRIALDRLAWFASEDAALSAERDAASVHARRRAAPEGDPERLADAGVADEMRSTALDAEIADAIDRLGPRLPDR